MVDAGRAIQAKELSDETLVEICRAAQVIACECPGYLARILRQVRVFRDYTSNCMEQFPNDIETHKWLAAKADEVENILVQTMIELMQKEKLIDDACNIDLDKLSDRAREIVLKQVGRA